MMFLWRLQEESDSVKTDDEEEMEIDISQLNSIENAVDHGRPKTKGTIMNSKPI